MGNVTGCATKYNLEPNFKRGRHHPKSHTQLQQPVWLPLEAQPPRGKLRHAEYTGTRPLFLTSGTEHNYLANASYTAVLNQRHQDYAYTGNVQVPDVLDPGVLKNTGYNWIWNQHGWLDYRQHKRNEPDLFHKYIENYILVLKSTPLRKSDAVLRVEKFLKSEFLYPPYKFPQVLQREQNYFWIMWYVIHSLPLYIKTYDQRTRSEIVGFLYDVALTHPCSVCSGHFMQYQKDNPWTGNSLAELVFWLCNFHNNLNTKLGKPWFDCKKYAERWGIQLASIPIVEDDKKEIQNPNFNVLVSQQPENSVNQHRPYQKSYPMHEEKLQSINETHYTDSSTEMDRRSLESYDDDGFYPGMPHVYTLPSFREDISNPQNLDTLTKSVE